MEPYYPHWHILIRCYWFFKWKSLYNATFLAAWHVSRSWSCCLAHIVQTSPSGSSLRPNQRRCCFPSHPFPRLFSMIVKLMIPDYKLSASGNVATNFFNVPATLHCNMKFGNRQFDSFLKIFEWALKKGRHARITSDSSHSFALTKKFVNLGGISCFSFRVVWPVLGFDATLRRILFPIHYGAARS